MERYVVVKSYRLYRGGPGYSGVQCERAGVEPGRIYDNRRDAARAADALSALGAVAFWAIPYREYPSEHKPWRIELRIPQERESGPEEWEIAVFNKERRHLYRCTPARIERLLRLTDRYLYKGGLYYAGDFRIWEWDFNAKSPERISLGEV